ncbi:MAG: hypothetical protein AAF725_02940 [Acidobacteriota bacterium]
MKNLIPTALLLGLLGAGPALAEDPSSALELELNSISGLDFTDGDASFDLQSAEASFEIFDFTLTAGIRDFSWTNARTLGFANGAPEPWEQLKTVSLRRTFNRPIRDRLFWTTSLGAGLSFEEESDDSYFADVVTAFVWSRTADWSFLFGVGYAWHSEVELEFELFPAIGFTYRGRAEEGFSASLGIPETGMRYRFSPRSALSLGVNPNTFVSRLADDSAVSAAGYAEFIQFDLGFFYEHRFADRFELRVGPTLGLEGELKIHDSQGVLLSTEDLESAPGASLQLKATF